MTVEIRVTEDAIRDLENIHAFYWDNISPKVAYLWLNQTLADIAERMGLQESTQHPEELFALGIREYREIRLNAHRIIYRLIGDCAYIYLVTDGRKDMQSLLSQRFLMG